MAALGVPAHVTVLVPFVAVEDAGPALLGELTRLAGEVEAFEFSLGRVERWEPGIVWLPPEPDVHFRRLTGLVTARWPDYPPYGGVHDENVPHLTVTHGVDEPTAMRVAAAVRAELPIAARAEALELWRQDDAGRWASLARFPLAS